MFTRRSLFKFLAAAPVAAAIEVAPAMPTPPPLPKLAVPPPPSLETIGMGGYVSSRFIVPQNPILDESEWWRAEKIYAQGLYGKPY